MASSSSSSSQQEPPPSSSSRATQAAAFYQDFTRCAAEVEQAIEQAKDAAELTAPLSLISQMRVNVTENHDLLPAYDRNTYESKLKLLAGQVTGKRAELNKARGRFAFQRPAKPPPPPTAAVTSASVAESSASGVRGGEGIGAPTRGEKSDSTIIRDGRHGEASSNIASPSTVVLPPPISRSGFVWAGKKRARLHFREMLPPRSDSADNEARAASDLHLTDLEHCFVDLRSSGAGLAQADATSASLELRAVQIRNVRSSIIFLADVHGSVMLHNCHDCIIATRCRQYRMHDSDRCVCLLTTESAITLEGCQKLLLAPYDTEILNGGPPSDSTPSLSEVQDFDHVSRLTASPNWQQASPEQITAAKGLVETAHRSGNEDWTDKLVELFEASNL